MIQANCLNRSQRHHHYHDHNHNQEHEHRKENSGAGSLKMANNHHCHQQKQQQQQQQHQIIARGTSRRTLAKPTRFISLKNWTTTIKISEGGGDTKMEMEMEKKRSITCSRNSVGNPLHKLLPIDRISAATCGRPAGTRRALGGSRLAFIAIALTFVVSFILLTLTQEAHALNCYSCSSADNPACDESFSGRANFTDTDCVKQIGQPAKVCRKIVQFIEDKKVIIRSCGWIDERSEEKSEKKPMCYKRSGTFALMMESCVCYEDNCNHSASLVPNQSVLTLLTGSSIFYFYLARNWAPSKRLL